ncbi:hydrogenase formation protein HypD [Candidatus Nomurabacteria bacterium]|nr:hydrogenase formation protein HypD [Candidatus Nomurabacteria bacterium]
MKFIEEFRDPKLAHELANTIHKVTTKPWKLMEICGGQTHAIIRFGIDQLLPKTIELIHGPGCPVCVTPIHIIDQAIEISKRPGVIFCSFGDMLRVPGTLEDLLSAKANGADIRMVYSPLDAVKIAEKNPNSEVVFFAVGFETTAPANAMAVYQAYQKKLNNFSILASHVLVPPAIEALLSSPQNKVQGFLAAGHVCTIMGYKQYEPLAEKYKVPIVVTGFEPLDLLEGILLCVKQLEKAMHFVENQYTRSVKRDGNEKAMEFIKEIFDITSTHWRGLGTIPESGLKIRDQYCAYDAKLKFKLDESNIATEYASSCQSGLILQGLIKPPDCKEFSKTCTPENPLGATMVSSEGVCAAYYKYRR